MLYGGFKGIKVLYDMILCKIILPHFPRYSDSSSYSFSLVAKDSGGKKTSILIEVQVLDSVAPPKFQESTYDANLADTVQIGTSVLQLAPTFKGDTKQLRFVSVHCPTVVVRNKLYYVTVMSSVSGFH